VIVAFSIVFLIIVVSKFVLFEFGVFINDLGSSTNRSVGNVADGGVVFIIVGILITLTKVVGASDLVISCSVADDIFGFVGTIVCIKSDVAAGNDVAFVVTA